jgi:hypothetical protein
MVEITAMEELGGHSLKLEGVSTTSSGKNVLPLLFSYDTNDIEDEK